MKKKLLFFVFVFFSSAAIAKTLLISDIDDTIKRTAVNHPSIAASSIFKTHIRFTGISEIYQALVAKDPSIQVFYISAAPEILMGSLHQKFLKNGAFPAGELILRRQGPTADFKVLAITKVIQEQRPDRVILVGDNGEYDPLVYAKIQNQFPNIRIFSYIHFVFDPSKKPIEKKQIGYAYAAELAFHLQQMQFLTQDQSQSLILRINGRLDFEEQSQVRDLDERSFPSWLDCGGHKFNFSGSPQIDLIQQTVDKNCTVQDVDFHLHSLASADGQIK